MTTATLLRIIERYIWQQNELRQASIALLRAVPTSADMRLLHVAAFSQTTDDYDALDGLKDRLQAVISQSKYDEYWKLVAERDAAWDAYCLNPTESRYDVFQLALEKELMVLDQADEVGG